MAKTLDNPALPPEPLTGSRGRYKTMLPLRSNPVVDKMKCLSLLLVCLVPCALSGVARRATILDENEEAIFYAKRAADDLVMNEAGEAIFYAKRSAGDEVMNEAGEAIFYAKRSENDLLMDEAGEAIFYAKRSADDLLMDEAGEAIFYAKRAADNVIENEAGQVRLLIKSVFT